MTAGADGQRYRHAEAFALMTYRAEDGEQEVIWNSRDGVTPFVITLRSGKEARHVNWASDRHAPDHVPQPGERVFVDLDRETHRQRWLARARQHFDDPGEMGQMARRRWPSAEAMGEDLDAEQWRPGLPDLIEIGPGERLATAGGDIAEGQAVTFAGHQSAEGPPVVMPYVCKHGVPAPSFCVQCAIVVSGV